jgi:hypothetical protein
LTVLKVAMKKRRQNIDSRYCIVNLLADVRSKAQYIKIANLCDKPLQHRSARHAFPRLEGLSAQHPLMPWVGLVTTMHKEMSDLFVGRSETLQVRRRLEVAHQLLAHLGRLVRVFRPVVRPLALAVFDVDPQIPFRRRVTPELVGDQYRGAQLCFLSSLRTRRLAERRCAASSTSSNADSAENGSTATPRSWLHQAGAIASIGEELVGESCVFPERWFHAHHYRHIHAPLSAS